MFGRKKKQKEIVSIPNPVLNGVINSAIIKEAIASASLDEGETHTFEEPVDVLEQEIKQKKAELKKMKEQIKQKQEADKLAKEEAERLVKEQEKLLPEVPKPLPIPEVIDKFIKVCPLCNGKVKKGKVKTQDNIIFIQEIKCRNKQCTFQKILTDRI
jgi:hypothetical protein